MVLAAEHVGDPHGNVVDHARQHVSHEPSARRTTGSDICAGSKCCGRECRRCHSIGARAIEQEAPVRALAGASWPHDRLAQLPGGAVVDRRQAAPEQDLALEVELLRGLVAAIDPPARDQRANSRS
jgi:hypothetical protein